MAIVNNDKRWLYLMEPHTASRATGEYLCSNLGGSRVGHHHIGLEELTNPKRPHLHLNRVQNFNVFCTVRNPLDVLVTKWFFHREALSEFEIEEYAESLQITVQEFKGYPWYCKRPFRNWVMNNLDTLQVQQPLKGLYKEATHWVYYEALDDHLSVTFNTDIKLPVDDVHVTKGKNHWSSYYEDEEMLEAVLSASNQHQELGYEYEFNEDGVLECHLNINRIMDKLYDPTG